MEAINNETPNFLMIPKQLFDDYGAGKLTIEEVDIILHLFYKANIVSGRAGVNYQSIANDLGDLFKYYKNPINQANKVMLSLLKKRRIWFEKHSGSRGKFEVWIDQYPCKRENKIIRLDLSNKFGNKLHEKYENPAELFSDRQRSKELKNGREKLINKMSINDAGRASYTDIDIEKEIDGFKNNSVKEERNVKGRALLRETIDRIKTRKATDTS